MRFVVFLFGFLGCLLTALLGAMFYLSDQTLAKLHEEKIHDLDFLFASADRDPMKLAIFLFIGAILGLLGALFALFRCGWQGSLLMFVPLIGPAVLNPLTLAATGPQAFAALLALFVGPLPLNPASVDEDKD